MKSLILVLSIWSLAACGSVQAPPGEPTAGCQTLRAATGTNRLTWQTCAAPDQGDIDAARASTEALQRDQIQRSLPRPKPGAP